MIRSHAAASKRGGGTKSNAKGEARNGKQFHLETPFWPRFRSQVLSRRSGNNSDSHRRDAERSAGDTDGVRIAPALDTASAVVLPASLPVGEPIPGPKPSNSMPARPATAMIRATIAGARSPLPALSRVRICTVSKPLAQSCRPIATRWFAPSHDGSHARSGRRIDRQFHIMLM